ncbi:MULTISPECIES: MarR family winged helix-turn-helix transcriptional regulator [Bacillaceae]|uniref:MarR family winged helix-turn-helix transcriptional regulator n=1 Tax=Bacillaceae TaxID=186817 RepID=UPI000BFB4041|nr:MULTISPECIES: MarR family transcriptional regulator [Bacillaceae]PGT81208.1 MarR family transcriptional regulator [Bacillus sp. AFS040349]UGB30267.1 MarR family transcriptional regulator [Metabacillus sp. B2-18]
MGNNEELKLDNQLCFSLYACSRAILRLYRPFLDEMNLTYPQYLVLLVLWEKQQSSVKELGELLELDSGTLTPMLKRMETAELIERRRDKADERVVLVTITEKGASIKEKAACVPQSLLNSSGMSVDEILALNKAIKHLSLQVHSAL